VYGLIDEATKADIAGHVPLGLLVVEDQPESPIVKSAVQKDQPLTLENVVIPANRMAELWATQRSHLKLTEQR
jgi:hypothetical protein